MFVKEQHECRHEKNPPVVLLPCTPLQSGFSVGSRDIMQGISCLGNL